MSGQYFTHAPSHITQSYHNPVPRVLFTLVQLTLGMRLVILAELAVCASLLNFVLLALESGPLYLFFVSYFIIIIIYLFIVYVLCDGETQEDWDTLDFMQVTGMIEWG